MAEACAKRAWAGRADLHYRHLDGVQGRAECRVSSSLPDPSVAEPIGHHQRIPENAHFLQVTESCRDW